MTYHKIKALSVPVVCDASATCGQCSNGYRKITGIALSATSSRVSNLEHVQLVKGLSDIRLSSTTAGSDLAHYSTIASSRRSCFRCLH